MAVLAAGVLALGALQVVAADAAPAPLGCTITGTSRPDGLVGGNGRDAICGRGGDDRLVGRGGQDRLKGGGGDDRLLAGEGRDLIIGGAGDDVLAGGAGNDRLDGRDRDRFRDVLRCGPGTRDQAFADPGDEVRASCEIVVQNDAPTDVSLSPSSVAENEPAGTAVGALSAIDPDPGDDYDFALVAGSGDADNASFAISGSSLVTDAVFDFETKTRYAIRVRATDQTGASVEKTLPVTVTNVAEGPGVPGNVAPTNITLSKNMVAENQPANTTVGNLSAVDTAGDTHTFTLAAGAGATNNGAFNITAAGTLRTSAVFDFETKSSYTVRVRATDQGGRFFERQFTITVTDVAEPPLQSLLDNLEGDVSGWTASGLWHLTNSSSCSPPGDHSATHAFYFGDDATCNYASSSTSGELTSPNYTGMTGKTNFSFKYALETETSQFPLSCGFGFDVTSVEVSYDSGTTWNPLGQCLPEGDWTTINFAIAPTGDTLKFRFGFFLDDPDQNDYLGWFVDDLAVQ